MMKLIQNKHKNILRLKLSRNLVRTIKRGHAWIYADALVSNPKAEPGQIAVLADQSGKIIGTGFYDPQGPIALRMCTTNPQQKIDQSWAAERLNNALNIRNVFKPEVTSAFRLLNGEGDGTPGLVCDVYNRHAVLQMDGFAAASFWDPDGISQWLNQNAGVDTVILRNREKDPEVIYGKIPDQPVSFLENSHIFTADLLKGHKTGFYLDQRDNRLLVQKITKQKSVLNLFGYTGGFSIYAGKGGAKEVTTVDIAEPALEVAKKHWRLNGLPENKHHIVSGNAFDFLEDSSKKKLGWDLVILDPPSFAPSQSSVPKAQKAYQKLISDGAMVTTSGGMLAAASCSSHITMEEFIQLCQDGVSLSRRKANLLSCQYQPIDHPSPLVMPELRYLKFLLLQLD